MRNRIGYILQFIGYGLCWAACALYFSSTTAHAENPWAKRFTANDSVETSLLSTAAPAPKASPSAMAAAASYDVSFTQAEQAIADAMVNEGAGEHVTVMIEPRNALPLRSHHQPLTMEIDALSYNAEAQTWSATLYFYSEGKPLAPTKLEGRYEELMYVPVLRSRLRSGELIQANDIEEKFIAESRLKKNTLMQAELLIGKSPLRTISPNRPIRADEVISPPVVEKGEKVTMLFQQAQLQIKALGEALEPGAEGETIRVRNSDSNVVVETTVLGSGIVQAGGLLRHESYGG